jgi:ABC-2 type transport system ATP-binding protein
MNLMDTRTPIIEAKGLQKVFKNVTAVDGLDLAIYPGEIFGIVGPDGAGKTTLLRLFDGLLTITDGELCVSGVDIRSDSESIKSQVGYMAQRFSLYGELNVLENLQFFADMYDVFGEVREERIRRSLDFARLEEFTDRRAANLSGGMQKKLALACSLIHAPPILLLDEPTTGVDPISRREFWEILTDLHLEGTTIVVSTPYMDEAERCNRVGLMYAGKLIMVDDPKQIRSSSRGELIELIPSDWQGAREMLNQLPQVLEVQSYGKKLRVFFADGETSFAELESNLSARGIEYRGLRKVDPTMEEAFISLINQLEN